MPVYDQRGSEVMDRAECLARLASAAAARRVGRMAVCASGAPHIVPVDYSMADQRVVVRTGAGLLSEHVSGSLVAFEVDEVEDFGDGARVGWSVLVRGLATRLAADEVAALQQRAPQPSVAHPGGVYFTVRPDAITGRKVGQLVGAQGRGSR